MYIVVNHGFSYAWNGGKHGDERSDPKMYKAVIHITQKL